jgi:hypothetical protein
MIIDLNFLVFLVGLIGGLCSIFAFFFRLFRKIQEDGAETKAMIASMRSEITSTKEFHNCEFDRVDRRLDDLTEKLNSHEGRIVRLETNKK